MTGAPHIPVLLDEVIEALDPQPGDVVIDATFGAGGYTRALLERGAIVHAFDRDPDAIAAGRSWSEAEENPPRLVLHPHRFSEMVDVMAAALRALALEDRGRMATTALAAAARAPRQSQAYARWRR